VKPRYLDVFWQQPKKPDRPTPLDGFQGYLQAIFPGSAVQALAPADIDKASAREERFLVVNLNHDEILTFAAWARSANGLSTSGDRLLRIHLEVTGGDKLFDAIGALVTLIGAGLNHPILLWLDSSDRPLEVNGARFEDSSTYKELREKISAEIRLRDGPGATWHDGQVWVQLDRALASRQASDSEQLVQSPGLTSADLGAIEDRMRHVVGSALEVFASQSPEKLLHDASQVISSRVSADIELLEARLGVTAEDRFATRLNGLAEVWVSHLKEGIVASTTQLIQRTNTAFNDRADTLATRLETAARGSKTRDQAAMEEAKRGTLEALQMWFAPHLGLKGRWFGIGVVACAACLAVGVAVGYGLARAAA
jgi:hypothetical protein